MIRPSTSSSVSKDSAVESTDITHYVVLAAYIFANLRSGHKDRPLTEPGPAYNYMKLQLKANSQPLANSPSKVRQNEIA